MLKMKCSLCAKEITSPLLAEIEQIDCCHCRQRVPVKDVIIHAQGYSYHRNDLINRIFRYKTLVAEVAKERDLLESSPEASDESKKSLNRFLATLEEMMAGARNNLRIEFEQPLTVSLEIGRTRVDGRLANLSMQGACIELETGKPLPRNKVPLTISLTLPGAQNSFSLSGNVAWSKKETKQKPHPQVGINFTPLDQEVHASLWAFISNSAEQ